MSTAEPSCTIKKPATWETNVPYSGYEAHRTNHFHILVLMPFCIGHKETNRMGMVVNLEKTKTASSCKVYYFSPSLSFSRSLPLSLSCPLNHTSTFVILSC